MSIPRILHYPGSKWSMASWIISNMPEHKSYLEPFFGSGAVLFNKERATLETVNDLHSDVVNLFKVIRDDPVKLAEMVHWTPYSREEYYTSYQAGGELDVVERARRFLVRCWMARGAKTSDRTGWRHNIAYNGPDNTRQWSDLPHYILSITERLKSVQIECQPAVQLIERHNNPDTLIYADPPYLLSTRSKRMYKHEMDVDDHIELLQALKDHPGPVLLSAYDNDLYNQQLAGWRKETKVVQAEAGKARTETLFINPISVEKMGQLIFEW